MEGLGLRIAGNGSLAILCWCDECQQWSTGAVAAEAVKALGLSTSQIPVIFNYRGLYAICSVQGCGSDDVELNHFAPRAIFGAEAEAWPKAYLCRKHHREWGERVTPALNPPRRQRINGL